MISIKRGPCPPSLVNAQAGSVKYNKKDVVAALWEMQYGKCCYCERLINNERFDKEVEHFRPKSVFKALINTWENLLLVCRQCNGEKGNKFPVLWKTSGGLVVVNIKPLILDEEEMMALEPAIIDPSLVDPEQHIDYDALDILDDDNKFFGMIKARENSHLGQTTIKTIQLNNSRYAELRTLHYCHLGDLYINLVLAINNNRMEKRVANIKERFVILLSPGSEFLALTRAFAREKKLNRLGITVE